MHQPPLYPLMHSVSCRPLPTWKVAPVTGFQRFSNDSAYRQRAAKAAAGELAHQHIQAQQPGYKPSVARRLPLSRDGSGIGSDAADGSPVAISRSGSGSMRAGSASSGCSSEDDMMSPRYCHNLRF